MPEPKQDTTPAAIPSAKMQFLCPICRGATISENNVVHVRLRVTKWNTDPEDISYGEPADFGYPWQEIDGTIRTVEPNEAQRWHCGDCGAEFDSLLEVTL